MSRFYTVVFENVAVTVAQDFFELTPAANKPIRIWKIKLAQYTDLADASEEILRVSLIRVPATATSGSVGGTAPTPRLVGATGAAAGFTCEINNTTVATSTGTLETLETFYPNIRVGEDTSLIPESLYTFVNGTLAVVRLLAAPTDSITVMGHMLVEELG